MVFKFERKSTEKKCEKRKNWRLLWKKIRNNINQCNYWRQRCKTRRQAASKHTYVRVASCVRTCGLMRISCELMHTYVSAFTYIRVSTCLPTLQKNPLPFPCTVSPAVSLTVSPAVSPAESCAEFSQNSALYIILIYYI